jgi:hypothetical protein
MPVKASSALGRLQVVADGEGLTSRAGTALVAGIADRVGLTAGFAGALAGVRERRSRHEPGSVVRDLALTLADGGDCLADLRGLRDQEMLFGEVASDATAWRTLAALDEQRLQAIRVARAEARRRVWEQAGAPERVILDLDGTLVTAHSDKEGAAGTYKGGFGFHPLRCYEAETGEALAGMLRPGNAGFNTARDHIELLERGLAQLPAEQVGPGLLVRCDRAGATHAFLDHLAERGLRFSVGLDLTEPVREAILALPERAWQPATASDGGEREGAWVAELPLELASWPAGTRAICRRERPHPGAQLSFTDTNGYRFQVFLTNQQGARIARLEQLHRARAACEDRIRCGKDSGLRNLPFRDFQANTAWLELVLIGQDLLSWTQRLLLSGTELARCEPKRLRYRLLHVAGRLTRHARRLVLHLPRAWPWQRELLAAFERLRTLPA